MFEKLSAKLKGYRTFLLNLISMIVTVALWLLPDLINYLAQTDLAPIIPTQHLPTVIILLNVANIALRKVTDGPPKELFKSKAPKDMR